MLRATVALLLAVLLFSPAPARAENINFAVKKALNTEILNVNLANVALVDALDYLRESTGANINVNWRVLEAARISKDMPVNVKLRALPMRRVLQFILDDVSGTTPLTYFIDQGVIEITTREAADSKMITRVYDVGDLVVEIPDFVGLELSLTSATSNSGSGSSGGGDRGAGGGGGQGLFGNANQNAGKDKATTAQERGDQLVSTIILTVRPEVWQQNGGTATISYFRGKLIVTAPRSVQEMIGGSVD